MTKDKQPTPEDLIRAMVNWAVDELVAKLTRRGPKEPAPDILEHLWWTPT